MIDIKGGVACQSRMSDAVIDTKGGVSFLHQSVLHADRHQKGRGLHNKDAVIDTKVGVSVLHQKNAVTDTKRGGACQSSREVTR